MDHFIQAYELCNENKRVPVSLFEKLNKGQVEHLIQLCDQNKKDVSKWSFYPLKFPNEIINGEFENIYDNPYIIESDETMELTNGFYNSFMINNSNVTYWKDGVCSFTLEIESKTKLELDEIFQLVPTYKLYMGHDDVVNVYTSEILRILYYLGRCNITIFGDNETGYNHHLFLPTGFRKDKCIPLRDMYNNKVCIKMDLNEKKKEDINLKLKMGKHKVISYSDVSDYTLLERFSLFHNRKEQCKILRNGFNVERQTFLFEKIETLITNWCECCNNKTTITYPSVFKKKKYIVFTAIPTKLESSDVMSAKLIIGEDTIEEFKKYGTNIYVFDTSKYVFDGDFQLEIYSDADIFFHTYAIYDNILVVQNKRCALAINGIYKI